MRDGASAATLIGRHGWPSGLVYHGHAPGDDLLCTAVLHEMRRRAKHRLWVMTTNPSLFENNPDVSAAVPHTRGLPQIGRRLGWKVYNPLYNHYDAPEDRDVIDPDRHVISAMCGVAHVTGEIRLRPYLYLSPAERSGGRRVDRQIAIQSSGMSASYPMQNKQWFPERFGAVVSGLKESFNFVQIGSRSDPPLQGVLDLRGQTTLRQSAAVLAESLVYVGNVGLLMHLARAVECRSVIVYGGREKPSQSGYTCNENLYTAMACSPCWLRNRCPYDRECMSRIHPEHVIAAIERQSARQGSPLEVGTATIPEA